MQLLIRLARLGTIYEYYYLLYYYILLIILY